MNNQATSNSSIYVHDALRVLADDYDLPGPFTVHQGLKGDGMANTIDSLPQLFEDSDDFGEEHIVSESSESDEGNVSMSDNERGMGKEENSNVFRNSDCCSRPRGQSFTEGGLHLPIPQSAFDVRPKVTLTGYNDLYCHQKDTYHYEEMDQCENVSICSEFVDGLSDKYRSFVQRWNTSRRKKELMEMNEADFSVHALQNRDKNAQYLRDHWWLSNRGYLNIFESLPKKYNDMEMYKIQNTQKIGELAPGTIVLGTEMLSLKWNASSDENYSSSIPEYGVIKILKIESPNVGFVVYSVDGYPLIGPGLPSCYTEPAVWLWRVTCPAGAYVREGLELTSNRICILPYGSLVRVVEKTINEMGLARLKIETYPVKNDRKNSRDDRQKIVGWISETLNPLSGQTGLIVQPLPFPVPTRFRICLPGGALIRSDVELSSPEIGKAGFNTELPIVGMQYSSFPSNRCIQRLKLAGDGGWVSFRLNKLPPNDQIPVMNQIATDASFDSKEPGNYHIQQILQVIREMEDSEAMREEMSTKMKQLSPTVSSVVDFDQDSEPSAGLKLNSSYNLHSDLLKRAITRTESQVSLKSYAKGRGNEPCVICLSCDRNATVVHGETGHIACCLECARLLKARGDKCPVCRLPIDLVIQQFWA
jgi:hypothetical protein